MNLSYIPVGTTTGYITLVDDTLGGVIREIRFRGTVKSIQKTPLAVPVGTLNSEYRQPLGNIEATIPVEICQTYPDAAGAPAGSAAMLAAANAVLAILGQKVHLRYTIGASQIYFPNAISSDFEPNISGQTVEYKGTFVADLVSTTDPAGLS